VSGLRDLVTSALGAEAVVTGWLYVLLTPAQANDPTAAVAAVRAGIGDIGNLRVLLVVSAGDLDPVADADAFRVLRQAPEGSWLAYEISYQLGRDGQ
jgi:hypothetical protein